MFQQKESSSSSSSAAAVGVLKKKSSKSSKKLGRIFGRGGSSTSKAADQVHEHVAEEIAIAAANGIVTPEMADGMTPEEIELQLALQASMRDQ